LGLFYFRIFPAHSKVIFIMEYSDSSQKRRRVERIALTLPVRVEAKTDKDTGWNEITRFQSLSSCGAGFEIQHRVKIGQLLLITAPIPERLRCYDFMEQQYRVWAVVRYCDSGGENVPPYNIGVSFVGKYPPLSFHENPTQLYDLSGFTKQGFSVVSEQTEEIYQIKEPENIKAPEEIRKNAPRHPIPLDILIQVIDQNKKIIASETTVSENVSVSGVAVFTSLDVRINDEVSVYFRAFNVSLQAKVRNRRIGRDGMPRLHLEFLDRQLSLEGIE
jgi:hypothetical protein